MNALALKVPLVAQVIITAAAMYGVSKMVPALTFSLSGSTTLAVCLGVMGLVLILLGWALYLSHFLAFVLLPIFYTLNDALSNPARRADDGTKIR